MPRDSHAASPAATPEGGGSSLATLPHPLRIAVTGSGGFIGSHLALRLQSLGHHLTRLVRRPARNTGEAFWDPERGQIEAQALEGLDALVHLGAESIAALRWSEAKKARIRESRVVGTRFLCQSLAKLRRPPKVLVSASAVGIYGDRGEEILDESSGPGGGFLAQVCQAWEEATQAAADAEIRVVRLRIGVVLSARGGVLAKMLPVFRLGLGARFGSGRQWMGWIGLTDLLRAIEFVLVTPTLAGAVNATAPHPVRQANFTRTLGRVLHRPAPWVIPAWLLRAVSGDMARETLLASVRAVPRRLLDAGFSFAAAELERCLRHELAPQA